MTAPAIPIEQHATEIHRNAEAWRRKPILRRVYGDFYRRILPHLAPATLGPRLELGSGMGSIKEFIPDCVTSDIFPHPWLDRIENAYAIRTPDGSLGTLVLFDVWHHLEHPGTALREFHRVLRPGGRLVLIEPAASLLGRLIYGVFHHEPVGLDREIRWQAPADFDPANHHYYAAQGNAWRMFGAGRLPAEVAGWSLVHLERKAALTYIASGGFSHRQVCPEALYPLVGAVSRALDLLPRVFATRMIVVLEKDAGR